MSYAAHRAQNYPPVAEDLFEMFGLADIAAEVAREKPDGTKNALRKTYKNQIKRLGVLGRFEPVEKDWEEPKELLPEDQNGDDSAALKKKVEPYFGFGKITMLHDADFWRGRHHVMNGWTKEAKAAESRAVSMAKGVVPAKIWDSSVLGDVSPANVDSSRQGLGSKTAPGTPLGVHGAVGLKSKQPPLVPLGRAFLALSGLRRSVVMETAPLTATAMASLMTATLLEMAKQEARSVARRSVLKRSPCYHHY